MLITPFESIDWEHVVEEFIQNRSGTVFTDPQGLRNLSRSLEALHLITSLSSESCIVGGYLFRGDLDSRSNLDILCSLDVLDTLRCSGLVRICDKWGDLRQPTTTLHITHARMPGIEFQALPKPQYNRACEVWTTLCQKDLPYLSEFQALYDQPQHLRRAGQSRIFNQILQTLETK